MIPFFKPGTRTYTLSGLALVAALVLQAHAQGAITLIPLVKVSLTFFLTIIAPLLPIYLRKAIAALEAPKQPRRKA